MTTSAEILPVVRQGLLDAMGRLEVSGLERPSANGSLIRPVVAYAGAVGFGPRLGRRFWMAAAAVQLAHEASLVHDDVVDGAELRRGEPTEVRRAGVGGALLRGDHLLAWGYRAAAETASSGFMRLYAEAVERTIAGEMTQARRGATAVAPDAYEATIEGKSGELLGCALASGPILWGDTRAEDFRRLGRRLGVLYQMLDDLLDYCPRAETGKPSFGDYRSGLWTWPLSEAPESEFGLDPSKVHAELLKEGSGGSPLQRCVSRFGSACDALVAEVRGLLPRDRILCELAEEWRARAESVVSLEMASSAASPSGRGFRGTSGHGRGGTEEASSLTQFMARHSRSFRFALRFFPIHEREWVAGLYAYCRSTDEIVDGGQLPRTEALDRLDRWEAATRAAYGGAHTGIPVVDRVMTDAAAHGVALDHALGLIEGMRMDVVRSRYGSPGDLRVYTQRVASAVGLWMAERAGVTDDWVLGRAADLGHAMQLTNILRDVGEDWSRGRLYLPLSVLDRHELTPREVGEMATGGRPVDGRFRAVMSELAAEAEGSYESAFQAVPALPPGHRAPVGVAAEVYRGILGALRRQEMDPFVRRAHTGPPRKAVAAARALWRLWRLERGSDRAVVEAPPEILESGTDCGTLDGRRVGPAMYRRVSCWVFGLLLALGLVVAPVAPADAQTTVASLRRATDRAAADGSRVDEAWAELRRLRGSAAEDTPLLVAYEGTLHLLRAKHGWWPPSRWREAQRGLALLDSAVALRPSGVEIRYLRLVAERGLPGIFGRGERARDDAEDLARMLPRATDVPPRLLSAVARYLTEPGVLGGPAADSLRKRLPVATR